MQVFEFSRLSLFKLSDEPVRAALRPKAHGRAFGFREHRRGFRSPAISRETEMKFTGVARASLAELSSVLVFLLLERGEVPYAATTETGGPDHFSLRAVCFSHIRRCDPMNSRIKSHFPACVAFIHSDV